MTVFSVNGQKVDAELDSRESLLEVLQDRRGPFGTKKGCDHGQCGACTVHLAGRRVVLCLTLAVQAEGRDVRTIEGVADADGTLHPVQQAFIATTPCSAATARPARSCPAWRASPKAVRATTTRSAST
jgi:xanthine dehydrogenase YagT iron-sulfur-binding subunit